MDALSDTESGRRLSISTRLNTRKQSVAIEFRDNGGGIPPEDYENLFNFINLLKSTGVKTFIIHARKAMLGKFTPKENLNIPPLKYEMVYKLKKDFKDLEIIINGGISSTNEITNHLNKVDGVMVGR